MSRVALLLLLALCAFVGVRFAAAAENPETRIVFIVRPGPALPAGQSLLETPQMRDHGAYMTKLFNAEKITQAGPFTDGSGGIGIGAKGVTLAEMTDLLAGDPVAKSGIIAYEIKTWSVRLDKP